MTKLKENMLEFMKLEFATQNLEIVHRRNRTTYAVAEWRLSIRSKLFARAIGNYACVGSWCDTPQGFEYWQIMTRRIPIRL